MKDPRSSGTENLCQATLGVTLACIKNFGTTASSQVWACHEEQVQASRDSKILGVANHEILSPYRKWSNFQVA